MEKQLTQIEAMQAHDAKKGKYTKLVDDAVAAKKVQDLKDILAFGKERIGANLFASC